MGLIDKLAGQLDIEPEHSIEGSTPQATPEPFTPPDGTVPTTDDRNNDDYQRGYADGRAQAECNRDWDMFHAKQRLVRHWVRAGYMLKAFDTEEADRLLAWMQVPRER